MRLSAAYSKVLVANAKEEEQLKQEHNRIQIEDLTERIDEKIKALRPYNKLSPAQAERLDFLAEECAEVIKAIMKIKRHGYGSTNPKPGEDNVTTNQKNLMIEIGHVFACVDLLCSSNDINEKFTMSAAELRMMYIAEGKCYMHHQGQGS